MSVVTSLRTCVIVILFLLSFVLIMYWVFPNDTKISNIPKNVQISPRKHTNEYANSTLHIPSIIHQTWKTGSAPPSETVRWRDTCKALNPSYEFRMYNDDDLAVFVQKFYPQYLPLFKSLSGVYMADMARLLLVYHYGGIYLDLDFYCFRPYSCLEKYARHQAEQTMKQLQKTEELTDLLVVSREPVAHAELFRNKSRVVIQDFFMASPKHPFLKWLLDDRMTQFQTHPTHPSKGPFSYSIDKDIDRYYLMTGMPAVNPRDIYNLPSVTPANGRRLTGDKSKSDKAVKPAADGSTAAKQSVGAPVAPTKTSSTSKTTVHGSKPSYGTANYKTTTSFVSPNTTANCTMPTNSTHNETVAVKTPHAPTRQFSFLKNSTTRFSLIVELREDILHPLLDATNSRLYDHCGKDKIGGLTQGARDACYTISKKKFFNPTEETMLVHMWTHTYLGWSFLRGTFNYNSYYTVEHTMKPTYNCPVLK